MSYFNLVDAVVVVAFAKEYEVVLLTRCDAYFRKKLCIRTCKNNLLHCSRELDNTRHTHKISISCRYRDFWSISYRCRFEIEVVMSTHPCLVLARFGKCPLKVL